MLWFLSFSPVLRRVLEVPRVICRPEVRVKDADPERKPTSELQAGLKSHSDRSELGRKH